MQFNGKAQCAAKRIVDAFEAGNLPAALAPIFIQRRDNLPMRSWSWQNQLLCVLAGCQDARGYRQWEKIGRHVRKGEHAQAQILVPCVRKGKGSDDDSDEDAGEARARVYGFKAMSVFDVVQTEGEPLPTAFDAETSDWLANLPLREVAESWGLSIGAFDGRQGKALGWYRHKQAIAVGVKNLATWTHELSRSAIEVKLFSGIG